MGSRMLDRMTLQLEPIPPFRLDLTAWALRRQPTNSIDRFDGGVYQRILMVKRRMPDVYDMMNFFGRNYDLKSDTLDLTNLPTVLRAWGHKSMWKESKDLSKAVEEGRKFVEIVMEKGRKLRGQRIVVRDRRLVRALVVPVVEHFMPLLEMRCWAMLRLEATGSARAWRRPSRRRLSAD